MKAHEIAVEMERIHDPLKQAEDEGALLVYWRGCVAFTPKALVKHLVNEGGWPRVPWRIVSRADYLEQITKTRNDAIAVFDQMAKALGDNGK